MSRRGIQCQQLWTLCVVLIALVWHGPVVSAQDRVQASSQARASTATPTAPINSDTDAAVADAKSAPVDLLIGEGDLLQVSLYGMPEFNQQVRVSGTGEVPLPMIGEVQVRGLSTTQTEALIGKRLKDGGFFNDPQVTVLVREFATQGISVLGEVQKPGIYPILGPRKLFDLISAGGGTTPKAGRDIVISHRANPQNVETVTLSDDPKKSMLADVDVFPGDTVVVSKAGVIYVVGDVRLPGGFVMDKDKELTVLQALALAQGASSYASLNHSKLIHRTPNGVQEIPIFLKKIMEGKAEDPKLQADDILFIPHSGSREATSKGLNSILQTATVAAIYRF